MIPIPLFRADYGAEFGMPPETAEQVAEICTVCFKGIFHRENKMPKSDVPVVCVNEQAGYWQLECNDPEASREKLQLLVKMIRNVCGVEDEFE